MTELEKQLRSWTPRRPSARLKERLFGPAPDNDASVATPAVFSFAWLAPALPLMLVLCFLANQRGSMQLSAANGPGSFTGLILSNQSAAAWLTASTNGPQNILANTFEWTNAQSFRSSIRSLSAPNAGY